MSLLIAFFATLLLGHFSQYLTAKAIHVLPRPLSLWILQISFTTLLFTLFLLIHQRPILAGINTLIVLVTFLVVNHAKYKALREPLVFSDVYLYTQVIHHPRLFLPFLNIPVTVLSMIGGFALLYLAMRWESALTTSLPLLFGPGIGIIVISGYWVKKITTNISLAFQPAEDIRKLGFFNSLVVYTLQANDKVRRQTLQNRIQKLSPFSDTDSEQAPHNNNQTANPSQLQDIIVIQSESFFDVRRLYKKIDPKVLKNFDRICSESIAYGTLEVPSWGANTLRPEFAFLSGIDNAELEHYRFNPYQYLRDVPTPTIASHLKAQGYRCIAIHPHPASFFGRDKVFPFFGFDEFVDIADFDTTATSGPYISDHAVQQKITDIMDAHDPEQPLFIFAITMENHGPLHLESVSKEEVDASFQSSPPQEYKDLTVYLRHLANADLMLKHLTDKLRARDKEALLCFYGDHVPSMPGIYEELGFGDGRTDYFIWQNNSGCKSSEPFKHQWIEDLSRQIQQA